MQKKELIKNEKSNIELMAGAFALCCCLIIEAIKEIYPDIFKKKEEKKHDA